MLKSNNSNLPPPRPPAPISHPIATQTHHLRGIQIISNPIQQQQQSRSTPINKNNSNASSPKKHSSHKRPHHHHHSHHHHHQHHHHGHLGSMPFDLRRIKKIQKLKRKIRSIESEQSSELKREIEKIRSEKEFKLSRLKHVRNTELNEAQTRYESIMDELKSVTNDKKRMLMDHCLRELQKIKNRIQNHKKTPQTFSFNSSHRDENGRTIIKIQRFVKYPNKSIKNDISEIFNDWSNEINFSYKRMTRTATKNKKHSRSGCNNNYDLQRIRFHLSENEVKSDLKFLLNEESKKSLNDDINSDNNNDHGHMHKNDNFGGTNINYEDFMEEAVYSHGYNNGHHIGPITQRLGPLNDPQLTDPWNAIRNHPRRTRKPAVSYNYNDDNDNSIMYHSQDVQFAVDANYHHRKNNNNHNKFGSNNNSSNGNNVCVPTEEQGHILTVDSFTITHDSLVRINYLSNNTTIDARVVSIKKNQLSAKSIVGSKRKRVWYKDLRVGKINIVPARAYH